MHFLYSGEEQANKMIGSLDSQATQYYSTTNDSSRAVSENNDDKTNTSVIIEEAESSTVEEAESSLRVSDSLNNEEARAVLGRYEYQRGNIEGALHVFEGIDISAATIKIKISLSEINKPQRESQNYAAPPFSINTVGLLLESAYLKSKSLQFFGRYKEAVESCKLILDIIQTSLPDGLPENNGDDHKLHETLSNTLELLPQLWELANMNQEAILSFRKALLREWNLNEVKTSKIQKDFAVFLLYVGEELIEFNNPNLESQIDGYFIPKNNIEEAILILIFLLNKMSVNRIEWDPSILDHLCYALSVYGGLAILSEKLEKLVPMIIDKYEHNLILALSYYGQGEDVLALNLVTNIYKTDYPNCGLALLMTSKIVSETEHSNSVGVTTAKKAIQVYKNKCDEMVGVAFSLLGVSLSTHSVTEITEFERVNTQCEALECLEKAARLTKMADLRILYDLCLENAEQRNLDVAFGYAKRLVSLEGGSHLKSWLLLARILSAQKRLEDSETVIDGGLNEADDWDQVELLRIKAKIQLARDQVKQAVETYIQILGFLLQNKCKRHGIKYREVGKCRYLSLELETWNDLAKVYISLSQWSDAEACLVKSTAITNYSVSTRHTFGLFYEAKGLLTKALKTYKRALDADPGHVQSLVSIANVFKKLGGQSGPVARSFLNEALRVDRMNSSAWFSMGLLLKDEGPMGLMEAADCFAAAGVLKETEPIEPFRCVDLFKNARCCS